MSLSKEPFTGNQWDEVQGFDCGSKAFEVEVSDWLKRPYGQDSASTAIANSERPAKVWLYRLGDGRLVGFGALGKSEWRWKGKKDPKIPLTVIVWCAVQKEFQGQPRGPREERYAALILDDLIAEALDDQETHPVLGLCVHKENKRAIKLYKYAGFTDALDSFVDKETGVEYQRMAMVLNDAVLLHMTEVARKKKH
jgi:ribosomal protein S18 acetylase RimI-like enzyme